VTYIIIHKCIKIGCTQAAYLHLLMCAVKEHGMLRPATLSTHFASTHLQFSQALRCLLLPAISIVKWQVTLNLTESDTVL
jgi:hypothetical protein